MESILSRFKVLDELQYKLNHYDEAIYEFTRKLWNSIKYREVLKTMVQENLEQGIRPDGSLISKTPVAGQISEFYERYTIYLKKLAGKYDPDGRVTLKDKGGFYAGIEIKTGSDTLYIGDSDSKTEILESTWGKVLGISEEQEQIFIDMLKEELIIFTKQYYKNR